MTTETEISRGRSPVIPLLPWIIAGAMFLVYFLTLDHFVAPQSLNWLVNVSGWNSHPNFYSLWNGRPLEPVTFLVLYPLHWFSPGMIPIALNLFSAICATLTLALLVRSVLLLPHDRTHEQRLREHSDFSLLTIRSAWLPPLLAALVCGLQMTFWENAVEATGEMLDLLLFAYAIRCLLEYRIDLKESWLVRGALVFGLAMANNWLMIGFFPFFLAAMIWIRGLSFFNPAFLLKIAAFGLLGFCALLIFPLVVQSHHIEHYGFWEALRQYLVFDRAALGRYPRGIYVLVSLTSLLPLLLAGVRWGSTFGDSNRTGVLLATTTFHIVHGLFLLACIWVAFDPPFSPRQMVMGAPFLSFYYLGALSIGYLSGYFLLVFRPPPGKPRRRVNPLLPLINNLATGFIWIVLIAVPVLLICKNLPVIRTGENISRLSDRCFSQIAEHLPPGAIVLSDDSFRLSCLQTVLSREGKLSDHLLLDTFPLKYDPTYLSFLNKKHPQYKLSSLFTNMSDVFGPSDYNRIYLIDQLIQNHAVFYLQPSFGYFFERFYLQPQGLVYQLKPFTNVLNPANTNNWDPPSPSQEQIAQNQNFWKSAAETDLPLLVNALTKPSPSASIGFLQQFENFAHLDWEPSRAAEILGSFYSRSLNYWGVELEKINRLPEAEKCFEQAQQLNPENASARINHEFNALLQSGKKLDIQPPKTIEDKFGKSRSWMQILDDGGPFDDPSFCFELGAVFAAGGNYRQAIQQFNRVCVIAPDSLGTRLWLCKLFLFLKSNTDALASAEQALRISPTNENALFFKGVSLIQLGSYQKAIPVLTELLSAQTNNFAARLDRAIAYLRLQDYAAAKPDYEAVAQAAPKTYQAYYGLAEIAYQQKDHPALSKYCQLYLTNYYELFPASGSAPENEEVKLIKTRLKELDHGAP